MNYHKKQISTMDLNALELGDWVQGVGVLDCHFTLKTFKIICESLRSTPQAGEGALQREMEWLDQHCSFVADHPYNFGPFKRGELRMLAQAGIAVDQQHPPTPAGSQTNVGCPPFCQKCNTFHGPLQRCPTGSQGKAEVEICSSCTRQLSGHNFNEKCSIWRRCTVIECDDYHKDPRSE